MRYGYDEPGQEISWRRWNGDGARRTVSDPPWEWVGMGVAPAPKGRWRVFLYHVGHGLCMGYPLADVLAFAWRNRDAFGPAWKEARRRDWLEDGFVE